MLNKLKDKMNRKISQADIDAAIRYDLHTRIEGMPKHNKLCHGDFNPSNIIIAEDGTPCCCTAEINLYSEKIFKSLLSIFLCTDFRA